MEYRALGGAGVKVSPLCLGCMNFGWGTEEADSVRILHRALEAGINFLDTANVYAKGVSEEYVGKALQGRRDQVVLASKVHGKMGEGPNDQGNHRYHIRRQVEDSLRRLQTDRIDLYQLHRPDPTTPLDESLSALTDLVRQGKVLYLGTSTFPAWQLVEGQWLADKRNLERFVCEQPPYNILNRKIEAEVLPVCRKYDIAVIPWSPLAGGWLSGKYSRDMTPAPATRAAESRWNMESQESQRCFDATEKLRPLAKARGKTLSQFALSWMLGNPAITAPIIGPRTLEQLEDNLGALGWELTAEEKAAVDTIVPPETAVWR